MGMLYALTVGINNIPPTEVVYAAEERVVGPKEVRIEVIYNWTEERIIEEIHAVFPDAPIMEKVARCESTFKSTAMNPTNESYDKGIFQISEKFHGETYRAMGYTDMHDIKQNLAYARYLYDRNGLSDWSASKHCWNK